MNKFKTNSVDFKRTTPPKSSYWGSSADDSADLVYSKSQSSEIFQFYLDDEITEPSRYRNFHTCCISATPNDIIEVHINSAGGDVMSTLQIINSMQMTEASTVSITHGIAASAATMVALAAQRIIVMPHAKWMVHPPTYGLWGGLEPVKREQAFRDNWARDLVFSIYQGFLTEEEISSMIENHTDLWMNDEEIMERLHKRVDYFKELETEEGEDDV